MRLSLSSHPSRPCKVRKARLQALQRYHVNIVKASCRIAVEMIQQTFFTCWPGFGYTQLPPGRAGNYEVAVEISGRCKQYAINIKNMERTYLVRKLQVVC